MHDTLTIGSATNSRLIEDNSSPHFTAIVDNRGEYCTMFQEFNAEDDSNTLNLNLLIYISITLGIILTVLLFVGIYVSFFAKDDAQYDEETGVPNNGHISDGPGLATAGSAFASLFQKKSNGILLDASFCQPGKFDDDEQLKAVESNALTKMSEFEVELYTRTKDYQAITPPNVKEFGTYLDISDKRYIKDRGIQGYFFLPSINDNVSPLGNFLPSFVVQDKLDIVFSKHNKSSSTVLNYPLPFNKKKAVYFEVKVFRFNPDSNSVFSIGLVTSPYPYFRIPGTAKYSIAYESTGKIRINNPFQADTLLPKLVEGDVVGFGYRYKTGTIFITHNGKKLMDVTQNVGIDLFVSVGALNGAYTRTYTKDGLLEDVDNVSLRQKFAEGKPLMISSDLNKVHSINEEIKSDEIELHVNLGQIGYVFIEANVNKYSFGSVFGDIGIPPSYNGEEIKRDVILDKGEELPPIYDDGTGNAAFAKFLQGTNLGQMFNMGTTNQNIILGNSRSTAGLLANEGEYERNSSRFDQEHNIQEPQSPRGLETVPEVSEGYESDVLIKNQEDIEGNGVLSSKQRMGQQKVSINIGDTAQSNVDENDAPTFVSLKNKMKQSQKKKKKRRKGRR